MQLNPLTDILLLLYKQIKKQINNFFIYWEWFCRTGWNWLESACDLEKQPCVAGGQGERVHLPCCGLCLLSEVWMTSLLVPWQSTSPDTPPSNGFTYTHHYTKSHHLSVCLLQVMTCKVASMHRLMQTVQRMAQKSCRRACQLFCCPLDTLLCENVTCCPGKAQVSLHTEMHN